MPFTWCGYLVLLLCLGFQQISSELEFRLEFPSHLIKMPLTANEREKLHKSILGYLLQNSMEATAAAFSDETGLSEDQSQPDLLEKKWQSIVSLQKKVLGLQKHPL